MFTYFVYGLGLHSAMPLPELVAAATRADVTVRWGKVVCPPGARGGASRRSRDAEAYVFGEQVGAFLVTGGREIVVDPVPSADQRLLRLWLVGRILGLLLQQRGILALHGSAVAVKGRAAAFLAPWGGGKSTLAAALYRRGHAVVSDDLTAISFERRRWEVLPGFPELRLSLESAGILGDAHGNVPVLKSPPGKWSHRLPRGFPAEPLPLKHIYVLEEGPRPKIEPLGPKEAFLELARHSFVRRPLLGAADVSSRFSQCARLAERVPFRRLIRPRSIPKLARVTRLLEEDLARRP